LWSDLQAHLRAVVDNGSAALRPLVATFAVVVLPAKSRGNPSTEMQESAEKFLHAVAEEEQVTSANASVTEEPRNALRRNPLAGGGRLGAVSGADSLSEDEDELDGIGGNTSRAGMGNSSFMSAGLGSSPAIGNSSLISGRNKYKKKSKIDMSSLF